MKKRYDISGLWGLRLDEDRLGIEKEYYKDDLLSQDSMTLPGTTALAGKGKINENRETGFLTEVYPFSGYAWFKKEITIDKEDIGKPMELYLERTRMTKVWVDDNFVGEYDSLTTPHRFAIGDYIKAEHFMLTIMVANVDYPTGGGHLTSPDTQSNWCGITGDLSIRVYDDVSLYKMTAYGDIKNRKVTMKIQTRNLGEAVRKGWIFTARPYNKDGVLPQEMEPQTFVVEIPSGNGEVEICGDLGEQAQLWSEYNPVIYELKVTMPDNKEEVTSWFGLRDFGKNEHHFLINGVETYLRGKHDGMIFPLTGAAPTDVEEWLRIMGISKSYGINHYRYHTCCPPEAAFVAADLLGIYMEPQLPFWGTLTAVDDEYYNEKEQTYLVNEGYRILDEYGNHPSFCLMSLGNELWGSKERMGEIIRGYKAVDNRHLYTQGSNNFQHFPVILPEDDFWVGARLGPKNEDGTNYRLVRGSFATCDAPIGYVQLEEPDTRHNYDAAILPESADSEGGSDAQEIEIQYGTGVKKVKVGEGGTGLLPQIPVVGHEIGQYAVYPNFKEIEKYTGVFRARNFEIFRERLQEKGMLDQAEDFFYCSGKLSVQCYKEELEGFHRSRYSAGYQILDIQDFSGQGTALVGILDAFMDNKGHVTKEQWHGFCSDAVILAQFDSYILKAGTDFSMDLALSYYKQDEKLEGAKIAWTLSDSKTLVASGEVMVPDGAYGLTPCDTVNVALPHVSEPDKLTLNLILKNGANQLSENSYELTLFPEEAEDIKSVLSGEKYQGENGEEVWITTDFAAARTQLEKGARVLFLPHEVKESIKGFYCTDFWCYPMFRSISESMGKEVPVGTMGLCIQKDHPALAEFPTEKYSTPQWYALVTESDCAVLEQVTDASFRPIVQMIDNFERNHKLGILFEGKVGNGKLMVCTSRLGNITERPEVKQFVKSILDYVTSKDFAPEAELDMSELAKIF